MLRLRHALSSWLIVLLALASLTVGRPLHEAAHLAEPLASAASGASVEQAQSTPREHPAPEDRSAVRECVWCLLHAQMALHGVPTPTSALLSLASHAPPAGLRSDPVVPAEIRAAPA
ncbi:hypothetical protein DBR42_04520, partial [Pelomonas sp. HMWF004]